MTGSQVVCVTLNIPAASYDMSWSQIVWVLHYTFRLCLMTCVGHILCDHMLYYTSLLCLMTCPGQIVWVTCYTIHPRCVLWHFLITDCYTMHPSCVLWHVLVTDCVSVILYIPAVSYDMSWSQIVWVLHIPAGSYDMSRSHIVWVSWSQIVTLCIPAVSYDMFRSQIVWVLSRFQVVNCVSLITLPNCKSCESYHASHRKLCQSYHASQL